MATNGNGQAGGLPRGELLGRYRTYDQAQQVVDHLASQDFDIKKLTIVGNDLRSVEHIRSRLSYPRVAGAGAAQGAMFGLFIGLLIFLFSPEAPLANLLLSVLMGMGIWMIMGVVGFAVRKGRGFVSSSQMIATTFDIVCEFSESPKARQLVSGAGVPSVEASTDPTGVRPPVGPAAPADEQARGKEPAVKPTGYQSLPDGRPRYGVRLTDVEGRTAAEETPPPQASAERAQEEGAQEEGAQGETVQGETLQEHAESRSEDPDAGPNDAADRTESKNP